MKVQEFRPARIPGRCACREVLDLEAPPRLRRRNRQSSSDPCHRGMRKSLPHRRRNLIPCVEGIGVQKHLVGRCPRKTGVRGRAKRHFFDPIPDLGSDAVGKNGLAIGIEPEPVEIESVATTLAHDPGIEQRSGKDALKPRLPACQHLPGTSLRLSDPEDLGRRQDQIAHRARAAAAGGNLFQKLVGTRCQH